KLMSADIKGLRDEDTELKGGDEIVRIGNVPVKDYREYSAELAKHASEPLQITVRREVAGSQREFTFEVQPQPLHRFEFTMHMGPIKAVQDDSPAAKAGLMAGDVIKLVDGRKPDEGSSPAEKWTPQTLPDYLSAAAKEGRQVQITVERPAQDSKSQEVAV